MATPVSEVVKVNWRQVFPWLALFRTVALSLHVRQVLVGMAAAGLIALGHWILLGRELSSTGITVPGLEMNAASWVWLPMSDLIWPLLSSKAPPQSQEEAILTWWQLTCMLLATAWGLVIGGLAGGILVRRAAFEFAREESLSLVDAIRFVGRRSVDYLSAPALPLVAVLGLGLLLMLTGWSLRWLPAVGYLISLLWGVVWLIGIAMAVLLVLVLAAWPMMIAAVSINGGDGFDALSRGFGFVIDRWRYYAWCVLVISVYGGVCVLIVLTVEQYSDQLITWHMLQGAGEKPPDTGILPEILPQGGWYFCLGLIGRGLAYSFFWSSITIIYLVLRKSVDNAELQDIYLEGAPQDPNDMQALLNPQTAAPPTLLPIIDAPRG